MYRLKDHINAIHHVVIPKPKDSKTILFKPESPLIVVHFPFGVLSSIYLYDELFIVAIEVDNIQADWLLSSKAMATESSSSDVMPQDALRIRCILPERS